MATKTLKTCDVCGRTEDEATLRTYPHPAGQERQDVDVCNHCASMILHDVMSRFSRAQEVAWMSQRIQEVVHV